MELRQLRYFRAVAEELNFGRAAARLNLSQPPLSRQIRALEDELGFELFDRAGRGTQLTYAGRALLSTTNEVLARLEKGVQEAARIARGESGTLRIGFRESAMLNGIVPSILNRFREANGEAGVSLLNMSSVQQLEAVKSGEIDAGFVYFVPNTDRDELRSRILLRDQFVVALNQNHPLSKARTIHMRDLAQEKFIWFPRSVSPVYYDALYEACSAAGFTPRIDQYAPYIGGPAIFLVSAGMGISFVHRTPALAMKPDNVVLKTVEGLNVQLTLSVVWNPFNTSPLLRSLLRLVPQEDDEELDATDTVRTIA